MMVKKEVSLTAILRHRAKQQFESVKSGHGPIPTGQLGRRRPALIVDANPANHDRDAPGPRISQTLKPKHSLHHLSSSNDTRTGTSNPPKTLRARPSIQDIRRQGRKATETTDSPSDHTPAKDVNITKNEVTPAKRTLVSRSHKNDAITASPVMSAMLRSAKSQRTVAQTAHESQQPPSKVARTHETSGAMRHGGAIIRVKVAAIDHVIDPTKSCDLSRSPMAEGSRTRMLSNGSPIVKNNVGKHAIPRRSNTAGRALVEPET